MSAHSISEVLPVSPKQISKEFLQKILNKKIKEFSLKELQISGYSSVSCFVEVVYDSPEDSAMSLFVKFANEKGPKILTKEALFYTKYAPCLSSVPFPLVPAFIDAKEDTYLVLQNFVAKYSSEKNQAYVGNQITGCTKEEAVAVIKTYAKIHAKFWSSSVGKNSKTPKFQSKCGLDISEIPELRRNSIFELLDVPEALAGVSQIIGLGIQAFSEFFKEKTLVHEDVDLSKFNLPNDIVELAEKALAKLPQLLEVLSNYYVTIIHSDARLDNMIFVHSSPSPAPTPHIDMILLDWQNYKLGNPLEDIGCFIASNLNLTGNLRRDSEMDLLELYHSELITNGIPKEMLNFDEMLAQYRLNLICLFLQEFPNWEFSRQQLKAATSPSSVKLFQNERLKKLVEIICPSLCNAVTEEYCSNWLRR